MPRSFDLSADYEGSVDAVREAFADRGYWLARLADSPSDEATLDTLATGPDGCTEVATTQTVLAERLPGMVAQFHHGDLSFVRRETWSPVCDGRATATISGAIPRAPANLTGTATLLAVGTGARLEVSVTVAVNIPLVGGKVETFVGSQLVELLGAEQRFTTEWLRNRA
jgi:hypothetical protein